MSYNGREDGCPFCDPPAAQVRMRSHGILVLQDGYPVSPGHMLIIPEWHYETLLDLPYQVQNLMMEVMHVVVMELQDRYKPDGFNIGWNCGAAAGQSVMHCHMHVIPRYAGDHPAPRGGIRAVIPEAASWDATKPPTFSPS